jgi:hypothetical protein
MTKLIDDLTQWLQKEVCNKIKLKKASTKGDISYDYELVHPTAFSCFCPPQDHTQLPTTPSVTVQIDNATDDLMQESEVNIALVFSVWNTGVHDKRENPKFEKNLDGWRDLWYFIDKARNAIRKHFSVAGYEVVGNINIRPLAGDNAIMGTYPYFFGEVTFTIRTIESTNTGADILNML